MTESVSVIAKFQGKKQAIYSVQKENKITLYSAFIIRPKKKEKERKGNYGKKESVLVTDTQSLFLPLNLDSSLKITLHRFLLPGKMSKVKTKNEKKDNSTNANQEKEQISVFLTYYIFKVAKTYDLTVNLLSIKNLLEDFIETVRTDLKELFFSLGDVGRITGKMLEKVVSYNITDRTFILNDKSVTEPLTDLAKEFIIIEKSSEFENTFLPGPAVDLRVTSVFSTPSRIESAFYLGKTEEGLNVGLSPSFSYPLLVCGEKKIRSVLLSKIINSTSNRFLFLGENGFYSEKAEKLVLGENFTFNILSPMFMRKVLEERDYWRYLSDFLLVVKEITEVRNENLLQIPEIIKFYIQEYEQSEENLFSPFDYSAVTIDDIYTMLTSEPGGLIISDYQLASLRSVFTDISDDSVSTITSIKNKYGFEALLDQNYIIDFSQHSVKVKKIFLYSLLLQLYLYFQIEKETEPLTIIIENAELFFSSEMERTFIAKLFTLFDSLPINIILSTNFPSHLSSTVFDLTNNRLVATLRSAKCAKLIADSHNIQNEQKEMLLRLPQNTFLLLREDFFEKPILVYLDKEDVLSHSELEKKSQNGSKDKAVEEETNFLYSINENELQPVMEAILKKLDSKAQRGINTESLIHLFPAFEEEKVEKAAKLLELKGLIFQETVDKEGRKGEFWVKITPRGRAALSVFEREKLSNIETFSSYKAENEKKSVEQLLLKKEKKVRETEIDDEVLGDIRELERAREKIKKEQSPIDQFLDYVLQTEKNVTEISKKEGKPIDILTEYYLLLQDFFTRAKKIDFNLENELEEMEKYLLSLTDVLEDNSSLEQMNREIITRIFKKGISLLDKIHVKCSFKKISLGKEEDLSSIIEEEIKSDKWENVETKFDDEFVAEIKTNMSSEIEKMLFTDSADQVFKALTLASSSEKEDFVTIAKKAIVRLMKIKMQFYPNLGEKEFIATYVKFFESIHAPVPFKDSLQLIDEMAVLKDNSFKKKKELIAKIKEENGSFDFDLEDKSKDSLVIQLKEAVMKKLREEKN